MRSHRFVHRTARASHFEILLQSLQELIRSMAPQVFHHTVVIQYSQFACREAHGHKIIVFRLGVRPAMG